jgi:hypothetical protein
VFSTDQLPMSRVSRTVHIMCELFSCQHHMHPCGFRAKAMFALLDVMVVNLTFKTP